MKHHLPVNIYDDGEVDNELVNVSKGNKDEIMWNNSNDYAVSIVFKNSPFIKASFPVPAGGSTPSGEVRDDVQPWVAYDYEITSLALAKAGDPGIKIKP
jgi:hypothetical protein